MKRSHPKDIAASLNPASIKTIKDAWTLGHRERDNEYRPRANLAEAKQVSAKLLPLLRRMRRDLKSLARLQQWKMDVGDDMPNLYGEHLRFDNFLKESMLIPSIISKSGTKREAPKKAAMLRPLIREVAPIAKLHNIQVTARGTFAQLVNEIGKRHLPLWSDIDYRTLKSALPK